MTHFATLEDPRMARTRRHSLGDMLTIAICGFVCGVDNWVELQAFAKAKESWFRSFLELPNGIPSHDTFGRLFSSLDPEGFSRCFMSWMRAIADATEGDVVAIDGKTLRRSFDRAAGKAAIHMVSAWSTRNGMVLGQVKTEAKSNEITAIPRLLELLHVQGCIVTIDAMGCQREIAQDIVDRGADYVFSLKGNQSGLHEEVTRLFTEAREESFETLKHDYCESLEKDHGRIERRECWVTGQLDGMKRTERWPSLGSIGMVKATRIIGEVQSVEIRYFISSLPGDDAMKFASAVRRHWEVENNLHWVLDVAFDEDSCRVRKDNAPENMAMLRHTALNLLKADTLARVGLKTRRKLAGWDESYLLHLLGLPGAYSPPVPTKGPRAPKKG